MARQQLTDQQLELLLLAPDEISDEVLAQTTGIKVATVHATRWSLRKHGWTCRVSYGVCEICGGPMTRRGFRAAHQRYHQDCRPAALKTMGAVHHQARMARKSEIERNEMIDRLQEYEAEGQRATRAAAVNHLKRWTPKEDMVVLNSGKSALEAATELGRSLRAVKRRKHYLVHGN